MLSAPVKARYWSAELNGVMAVSIMVGLMLPAGKKSVMGNFTSGLKATWFGWVGVAMMGFAVLRRLLDLVRPFF